eukprot:symbB.v1.2.025458.t2/scaffold2453.1/size78854/3
MWCGNPKEDLWNDFTALHQNERTDLEKQEHRNYFGEKALRFGGVDIVLRTLALFRADERVGYHGVVSLFTEPLQGRARSILHYAARTEFFLQRPNFSKHIAPRFVTCTGKDPDSLTPQQIANTMLVLVAPPQTPRKLQTFRLVMHRFGAFLAASVEDMACSICSTSTAWEEVFCNADIRGAARVLWHLCEDTGPPFPPRGRGSRCHAEMLLEAQNLQLVRPLDAFELELEGADAQDPLVDENYSFLELVQRCVARRAFVNSGLKLLCEAVGIDFHPLPEGPEEDALLMAAQQDHQAIFALSLTCSHLAQDAVEACGSGHLTAQDLSVMAQTFWPELSQDELRDLFQNVCRNRSGYIQMAEFCAALGFDERSVASAAEALRSISQLDGALQVLLDRVRISVLEAGIDVADLFNNLDTGLGYLRYEDINIMARTFDPALTGQQLEGLFRHFDPRASGIVDFEGFKRGLGFMAGTVGQDQKNVVDQAIISRIAQAAQTLYSRGCSVQDAFAILDCNRNGFLDQTEFYRFLVTCDCRVTLRESDLIFAEVTKNTGRLDINTFAQAFAISPGPAA